MELNIRRLEESDYETLVKWWDWWPGWEAPPKTLLPDTGFIVEKNNVGIVSAYVYMTNSKTAIFDWVVSNPEYRESDRKDAIRLLIQATETVLRDQGINSIKDKIAKLQVETLEKNLSFNNIKYIPLTSKNQGIVHIIGPEQGFTIPGTTIVCGDSHTSTHGAFGSLAFGIGTSEVEHVLATQTLVQTKPKNMRIIINGKLKKNVTSKDIILKVISEIGTAAGTGHVIEFSGSTILDMTMEERMTLCNMSIEAGAKAGLIAPDNKTFDYLYGLPFAPKEENWELAIEYWKKLVTDKDAVFDQEFSFNIENAIFGCTAVKFYKMISNDSTIF